MNRSDVFLLIKFVCSMVAAIFVLAVGGERPDHLAETLIGAVIAGVASWLFLTILFLIPRGAKAIWRLFLKVAQVVWLFFLDRLRDIAIAMRGK